MTYTRYAVSGLPSAGRKISPPGWDLFCPVCVNPPRRTDSTPSSAGGRTESCDPTARRRGRRPLHALSLRGAKRRGNPFSFFRADSHASVRRGTWAPPYGAQRSCGADRVVRRDGISAGTRAVEHQGTHRGRGAASRDSASRKAVEAQSFEPGKTGKSVARGTGQREITADAREEVLKRSFKRRFW